MLYIQNKYRKYMHNNDKVIINMAMDSQLKNR